MQQDFPLSVSVLLLSKDGRSIFANSTHVPVIARNESSFITETKFNQIISDVELLQQLRKYFLLLTHYSDLTLQNYSVEKDCSEYAQNYFVQKRKEEANYVASQEAEGRDEHELE